MTAEVLYGLLAFGIVAHTALGGQKGILKADLLHAGLLLGGFSIAAGWCLVNRTADVAALPKAPFTEAFGLVDWLKMTALVGITYVIGPDMFSRTFAAKDGNTARRAAWTAAPLLVFFGVVVTMLALLNIDQKQPIAAWLAAGSPLPTFASAALAMGLISALAGSADTILLSAAGIIEKDLFGGRGARAVRYWAAGIGLLAALAAYTSGDIIGWLLKGYALYVPGVAVPLLILVAGHARRADPKLWMTGAVLGGLGGLVGSLSGVEDWTYAGIAASAAFALAAVRAARAAPHVEAMDVNPAGAKALKESAAAE